jgi:hypothetical protein
MFTKRLSFLTPLLVALGCALSTACSSEVSQSETAGNDSTAAASPTPSLQDGKGTARLIPKAPIVVNTHGTWKIVYTVGREGISVGGGIAVHISPYWGWTPPQNRNRDYPGYTTVSTSNEKATLDIVIGDLHYIVVRTRGVPLTDKQTITVTYGDSAEGKHPLGRARCDTYAEEGEDFFIKVDGDGDGHFYAIADHPRITILPASATDLVVTAPSLVQAGNPFSVAIAAVDPYNNMAQSYRGTVRLVPSASAVTIQEDYRFTPSDRGAHRIQCTITQPGLYYVTAEDKKSGFTRVSNPIQATDKPLDYNLYWGDIHGHAQIGDGTGTPDNFYTYARDVSGLDIAALTSHDAHGFIPLDEDQKTWDLIRTKTDSYYRPGVFVTFLGYEWTSWTYGHQHVLFLHSEEGAVYSFRDPKSATPKDLWHCLEGQEAITIPHHVAGGPIAYDWDYYNPVFQPVTEICSIHGNGESLGAPKGIYRPQENHSVQDALARGYRLGIVASGDSHNGHPGRRDPAAITAGLMGVYAEELTRESVWMSIKSKRVYGTSGTRMIVDFHINEHIMGETISSSDENSARDISGDVIGTDVIQEVTIIKNNAALHTVRGQGVEAAVRYLDKTVARTGDYYYMRVLQEDGEIAWSSPIWIELQDAL